MQFIALIHAINHFQIVRFISTVNFSVFPFSLDSTSLCLRCYLFPSFRQTFRGGGVLLLRPPPQRLRRGVPAARPHPGGQDVPAEPQDGRTDPRRRLPSAEPLQPVPAGPLCHSMGPAEGHREWPPVVNLVIKPRGVRLAAQHCHLAANPGIVFIVLGAKAAEERAWRVLLRGHGQRQQSGLRGRRK